MKKVITGCLAIAIITLALAVHPFAETRGKRLLVEIMDQPGAWSQMCATPPPVPFDPPVPILSGSLTRRHFNLGNSETKKLQSARTAVIEELSREFRKMDFFRPPQAQTQREGGSRRYGMEPDRLNPLHLEIIRRLNGVELLSEMLQLESQLNGFLEASDTDPKAPLPTLNFDIQGFTKGDNGSRNRQEQYRESAQFQRDKQLVHCRVAQRELLGTMSWLLQREEALSVDKQFAEESKSAREKQISKALNDAADLGMKKAEYQNDVERVGATDRLIQSAEEDVAQLRSGKNLYGLYLDYSPGLRTKIRSLVETFLKTVPPEQRKGAAAMPSAP